MNVYIAATCSIMGELQMGELRVDYRLDSRLCRSLLMFGAALCSVVNLGYAANPAPSEDLALDDVPPPPSISAEEPLADTFSFRRAVDYLDNAALDWQQRMRCVTCHTNGLFLASRAEVAPHGRANDSARDFTRKYLKRYVIDNEPPRGARGSIEGIVAATALLTISDAKTTGKLDPITRQSLDYVWTQQSEKGCWEDWLKCNWPPFEVDDHFGATLVTYAVGMAPEEYKQTPMAKEGMRKLRSYLQDHPPENRHQMAMLLLASTTCDGILAPDKRQEAIAELLSLQQSDGGWNLFALGDWQRSDGKEQDVTSSDGYATGFVAYVLRTSGVDAKDPHLQKAIAWLQANQRASGRWYTRSPRRDGKHYISHAGTAYAVMALAACGESLAAAEAVESAEGQKSVTVD